MKKTLIFVVLAVLAVLPVVANGGSEGDTQEASKFVHCRGITLVMAGRARRVTSIVSNLPVKQIRAKQCYCNIRE